MGPPSGPGLTEVSVCHASWCRFELPLGAMCGWRGAWGTTTARGAKRAPSNSAGAGPSCGPSGIGCCACAVVAHRASSASAALVAREDRVDEPVLGSFIGLEEAVALHVLVDLFDGLARVQRVDLVDAPARLEDLL